MSLAKVLYRDLVAAARQFDRHVSLRALVSVHLLHLPDKAAPLPHAEAFNRCLLAFLRDRALYLPDSRRPTLLQLVRDEYRKPESLGPAGGKASGVDVALMALRALNDTLAEAARLGLPLDAHQAEGDAEKPIEGVQLAEYGAFWNLWLEFEDAVLIIWRWFTNGFNHAVVVLTEHSAQGSRGFVVNQLTTKSLIRTFEVPSRIKRAFGSSKVRFGGPILHGRADFGGRRVVTSNFPTADDPSLFVGVDLETAARAVHDETALQSDVVFLTGASAWKPGQLDTELQSGRWVAVKAPVSLALNAPEELWQHMMQSLGGEYVELSRMPVIEDDDPDADE
ncbi:hypothetical protein BBJ28_00008510 [Nothophytophthora sp. Chile5]|nr:hypothetical protein BBJ28_00008510 [Nothophytophthora sp. Chile5]